MKDTENTEYKFKTKEDVDNLVSNSDEEVIKLPFRTKSSICRLIKISDGAEFETKEFKDRMFGVYYDVMSVKYKGKTIKWK